MPIRSKMLSRFFACVALMLLGLSLAGCKQPIRDNNVADLKGAGAPQGSESRDLSSYIAGCSCNDQACWQKAIRKYEVKAGICAAVTALTVGGELTSGHFGHLVLNIAECVIDSGLAVQQFLGAIKGCKYLKQNPSLESVTSCVGEGVSGSFTQVSALNHCIGAISKGLATSTVAGFGHIATGLKCGVTVVNGSSKLIGNSICLANDVFAAIESMPEYDPQTGILGQTDQATGPCEGQPLNCSTNMMTTYGRWLYENRGYYWGDGLLAADCQKWCGGEPAGQERCVKASTTGFQAQGSCLEVCRTPQCKPAVDACVSECIRPSQKQIASQTTGQVADGQLCGGESVSCSHQVMENYGMWLYKNRGRYFSNDSLGRDCASWCSGTPDGRGLCRKAIGTGGIQAPGVCAQVCDTPQCDNAVSTCIARCCYQDAECTFAASRYR